MTYPTIRCLDDVLPALVGRDEFIVKRTPYLTLIDYVYVLPDSFDDPIRRECRGIKFYPDGKIAARPLHKFFNVGERPGSLPEDIDWTRPHHLVEKLDGSMVNPVGGRVGWRLTTRKGLTAVARAAEKYLTLGHLKLFDELATINFTPTLEYIGPTNQIVVRYDTHRLVLLAARDMITGEYAPRDQLMWWATKLDVPLISQSCELPCDDFTSDPVVLRADEREIEGWVVLFDDGERYKIKTDRYLRLHRALDATSRERLVLELVLRDEERELLELLPLADAKRLRHYGQCVRRTVSHWVWQIRWVVAKHPPIQPGGPIDRRAFADQVKRDLPPTIQPAAFNLLDERGTADEVVTQVFLRLCRKSEWIEEARKDVLLGARWVPGRLVKPAGDDER